MDIEGSITRKHLGNCYSFTVTSKGKMAMLSDSPITVSTHDSTKSRLDELYQPILFIK